MTTLAGAEKNGGKKGEGEKKSSGTLNEVYESKNV
jgi:hypothetical protein